MNDSEVSYLGRAVSIYGFRVFVYSKNYPPKLVNSWDEFMQHVKTGEWFSSTEELQATEELNEFEQEIETEELINDVTEPEPKKRGRKKASK